MDYRIYGLFTALLLCSCAMNKPVPEDHYYKLPGTHNQVADNRLTDGEIFVGQFIADGLYRERPLLHTIDRQGIELLQYHYHHWVDSPSRMLRDRLISYLASAHAADRITTSVDDSVQLVIHGAIKGFERLEYGNTDKVNVELEFRVERTGSKTPVLQSHYRSQVDINGNEINNVVNAFDEALSRIFAALLSDLNKKLIH